MSNQNFARGRVSINSRLLLIGVVILAVVWLVFSTFVFVPPQTSAVVISLVTPGGYRKEPLMSGLHMILPFGVEHLSSYSISKQTYTMSSQANEGVVIGDDSIRARTKDGQEVFIDASVIFSIDPKKVVDLHITWQDRYGEELVRPTARGIVRDVASQYGVEEIVSSKRAELEEIVTGLMEEKFAENDLILVDFVLRDIHFSEEYAAAIEQKQIAEQQAQQANLVIEQKKAEAEQARQTAQGQADAAVIAAQGAAQARLIEAEAEAKALNLIAAVLDKNPLMLQYQYILKLAPNVQTIFIPTGNQFILPLPGSSTPATPVIPAQ